MLEYISEAGSADERCMRSDSVFDVSVCELCWWQMRGMEID